MQKSPPTPPWKRKKKNAGRVKKKMSAEQIAAAKERASAAGRPYPNLIDNMWAMKNIPN